MKTLFIVNPAAGHGRAVDRWQSGVARVRAGHPATEVWHTKARGDGAKLAVRGLEQGFEAVFAVGGDGTLGEVVDGFLGAPAPLRARAVLGTWPLGSGCDTARHLGIRADAGPEGLLALLKAKKVRQLDAGRIDFTSATGAPAQRFFINVAAWGLAGEVVRRMETGGKPFGGTVSYLLSSVRAVLGTSPQALDLMLDGVRLPRASYHLVAVANTSSFGGGMRIAPAADPSDGLLDVVAVAGLSRLELLRHFPKVYRGEHIGIEGVLHRRVRRLEAVGEGDIPLNIDGESLGSLPAVIEVLPAAVPFLVP